MIFISIILQNKKQLYNMKKIISLTFLLLSIASFSQQSEIKGVVRNEKNETNLSNCIVLLDGNEYQNTDKDGNFIFKNVKKGKHNIQISYLGFEKQELIIDITSENESKTLDIKLKENVIQIVEVQVTKAITNYNSKYSGSNSVISSKEIENSKPISTEEILKKVPGLNISGDMGISNRLNVGIRGSYPRRSANILIMEDGTPIAPAPYLAPEAYYNPPSERLDGIEIMKGTDILAFGSNTMYGAINYITKKPPLKPTLGLNITEGENAYHSQYLTYGGTWDKVGAEIQVLNKQFGGFQDNSQTAIFNTTAKIYTEINPKSSFYLKLNYHQEKSKASYSALTPYSYAINPKENPFDADDLKTNRIAVDLIYNYKLSKHFILTSKVYATQFQRDWWRQENTLILASTAKQYLGEEIYYDRFSYLDGQTFGANDYIRVGKVVNGRESTRARNRTFKVAGIQETLKYDFAKNDFKFNAEISLKGHFESFANIEMKNDSSRFSRSGTVDKDQLYTLATYSVYLKTKFSFKKLSFVPSLRFESLQMYGFDKIAISKMTDNDGSKNFGSLKNTFTTLLPGASLSYAFLDQNTTKLCVFGGIYKGYTAPIADFAFLNVEDGVVSKPTVDREINRKPEESLNYEFGLRGDLLKEFVSIQLNYFNNNIKNYYSAGRNEAFQTLGAVNINGVESSINLNLHKLMKSEKHQITLNLSGTIINSKILSGKMSDSDLLKAKHTDETKSELIDKINSERVGYDVYFTGVNTTDSLVSRELTVEDFSKIKRLDFVYGENGISNNAAPYIPPYILNFGFTYAFSGISFCANVNYVAKQYTDYLNFENETSEGAIGSLKAFKTLDLTLSYSFEKLKSKYISGLNIYVSGKNITNEIYKSSRLHRVSSGIMPSGFRQINVGLKYNL
jgi:Fe(3+) dicitrate transport protein